MAWRQATLVFSSMLAATIAVTVVEQRPAGADELKIPIAELRSQAFELNDLNAQLARGTALAFIHAHARQLAHAVGRSREELAALKMLPRLTQSRSTAMAQS